MLACVLRPSRLDGAKHAAAVIRLIVARLCRAVGYVIGVARDARHRFLPIGWNGWMSGSGGW